MRAYASLLVGVALLIAACSRHGSTASSSALKPIDKAALQTLVDTTAKELLIRSSEFIERKPLKMQAWVSGGALEGFALVICG